MNTVRDLKDNFINVSLNTILRLSIRLIMRDIII